LNGVVNHLVCFDHDKLDKIVSNLLSNALRYTPEGGQIIINYSLIQDKGSLQIEVVDTGKGIDSEMLPNVFERFYQVQSVTGKTFGAGIGLALAKNLAEIHKGSIKVDNHEELGARFTLTLPVMESSFNAEEMINEDHLYKSKNYLIDLEESRLIESGNIEDEVKHQVNETEKILIVEDNHDFRQLVKTHLSNYFQTIEAEDGQAGFEVCLEQQPSLVITDMMMPKMDGIELCKKIKNTLDTSHIMVIMLTARTDEDTRFASYQANADSYISKPVDIRTLQVRINSLLQQRCSLLERYSSGNVPKHLNGRVSDLDKQFLQKAQEFIESKLTNSELNVVILNRELGTSNSMLYRKITNLTGMSPVEYIRFIRLQNAAKMLQGDDVNVSEAAYSSGFNDLSYFSKCFKKQFGISPKQYSIQHN